MKKEEIEEKALTLPERAREVATIADQREFSKAGSLLRDIVTIKAEIIAHHEPIKKAAWAAHKAVVAAENKLLEPVEIAEREVKRAIAAYEDRMMRIQAENERKAREQAEKEARERERVAQEEAAVRAKADMDALLDSTDDFDEALAIMGQTAEVVKSAVLQAREEERAKPVYVDVEPVIQRVSGISTFTAYSAEVFDIKELCHAIAAGEQPVSLVTPNMVMLNKLAGIHKTGMKVPGVRVRTGTQVGAKKR